MKENKGRIREENTCQIQTPSQTDDSILFFTHYILSPFVSRVFSMNNNNKGSEGVNTHTYSRKGKQTNQNDLM